MDRPPTSTGVFMVCFGVFIIAFCVVAVAFSAPGSEDRYAAVLGAGLFGLIGLALVLGGADSLTRMTELAIHDDSVSFSVRKFFRLASFSEPLSAYACVLPETEIRGSAKRELRMAIGARLVHGEDDSRNIGIFLRELDQIDMLVEHGGERVQLEELARSLDLPLASVRSDGTASVRYPDELDLPLAPSHRGDTRFG